MKSKIAQTFSGQTFRLLTRWLDAARVKGAIFGSIDGRHNIGGRQGIDSVAEIVRELLRSQVWWTRMFKHQWTSWQSVSHAGSAGLVH
jgi:hypothetical protein